MKKITRKKNEKRKDYLFRVALAYLKQIEQSEDCDVLGRTIVFDGAKCDGSCLIEDMQIELGDPDFYFVR
ncbi:MAG: hypothetical protein L6Q29_03525 [Candidatus Pacebacteria bacterium]|nr:hypothetical protein [Candidatus Paceibacterota bacterium]